MKKSEIAIMVLVIFFVILFFNYVVVPCQTNAYMEFSNHCNETYGEGDWIVIEGGYENVSLLYPGQVWECVPCNQT